MRNLPYDVVERETAVLQAMNTEDFRRVINDLIDESEMIWVIVGDGETQRERLKEFGYGTPIELDKQGRVLVDDYSNN